MIAFLDFIEKLLNSFFSWLSEVFTRLTGK